MADEIKERESALEQQYHELLDETKRKLQSHEVTIQRLTSTLADKEQQLQVTPAKITRASAQFHFVCIHFCVYFPPHQEYINMVRDFEQNKSPGGNDGVLSKLRQRLKEKEKALEVRLRVSGENLPVSPPPGSVTAL